MTHSIVWCIIGLVLYIVVTSAKDEKDQHCFACWAGSYSTINCTTINGNGVSYMQQGPRLERRMIQHLNCSYFCTPQSSSCGYCIIEGKFNCTECDPGFHQDEPKQTSCKKSFMEHRAKCVPCDMGHYCPVEKMLKPRICQAGYYQDDVGQKECKKCGRGSYNPNRGRTIPCELCDRGHFCHNTTMLKPSPCPRGYYCPHPAMWDPLKCLGGTYCPYSNETEPRTCPAGYYCPGGAEAIECPENSFCDFGASSPTACFALFQSPKQSTRCSPSIAFYVVVVVSSVLGIVVLTFFYWKLRKSNQGGTYNTEVVGGENKNLIPQAKGPQYTGL